VTLPGPPPLAPPPPPPSSPAAPAAPALQPGQLTQGWKLVLICGWVGVILAYAAVWKSSWTLGFSTWWLGPQAEPRFLGLLVLPFLVAIAVLVLALANVRYAAIVGIVAAFALENIAWGDVGRQIKFAVVEFSIAGGALLISAACLAGMVRHHEATGETEVAEPDPEPVEQPAPLGS
jgi:hypothetical protein